MTDFATADDLKLYLNDATIDDDYAEFLIRLASAAIRNYTNQQIDEVADDEIVLAGNGRGVILLPQVPVTEISDVSLDGIDFTLDTEFSLAAAGILTRIDGSYWTSNKALALTYTHGYATIPDDILLACLQVTAKLMSQPDQPGPKDSETIGDYSYQLSRDAAMYVADERSLLAKYRMRRLA